MSELDDGTLYKLEPAEHHGALRTDKPVQDAIDNRRKVTNLLTYWCAFLSLMLVIAILLGTVSILNSASTSSTACTSVQTVVQQSRDATNTRIAAIKSREGIYKTYSQHDLKIALDVTQKQLADFPEHTC